LELILDDFLPHRAPMILLSKIIEVSEASASCQVDITEQSMFFEDGRVPPWVGIEYVAQTVAVYSGNLGAKSGGQPTVGFLLGVRKYRSGVDGFLPGQKLVVKVEPILVDGDIGSFRGVITIADRVVAEVTVTTCKASEELLGKFKRAGDAHE
jgi:predicted hotdog family 3-hydroxylacyl-ACP dehydratase